MAYQNSDEVKVPGKIALVTGAARGIGRACALALAEAGADIALGLKNIQADSGLVKEIEALGRRVLPLQMDVSRMEEIKTAVKKAAEYFGRIDILINNAGISLQNDLRDRAALEQLLDRKSVGRERVCT